ncbi:hypothetical protein TRVL_06695 [Trypanosoma vivax]|nr:hypothetical protein TRVL_06695 [Trypanosoma vivax]
MFSHTSGHIKVIPPAPFVPFVQVKPMVLFISPPSRMVVVQSLKLAQAPVSCRPMLSAGGVPHALLKLVLILCLAHQAFQGHARRSKVVTTAPLLQFHDLRCIPSFSLPSLFFKKQNHQ